MNVHIRSSEYAWQHTELKLLGRVITGLRGWEFRKAAEKEHLFGAGNKAIDIQTGNVTVTGNIVVLGFELDRLNQTAQLAGFQDIAEVPHEAIALTLSFRKTIADPKTTVLVRGIAFTEYVHAMQQNAKMREVTLPLLAMDMISVTT